QPPPPMSLPGQLHSLGEDVSVQLSESAVSGAGKDRSFVGDLPGKPKGADRSFVGALPGAPPGADRSFVGALPGAPPPQPGRGGMIQEEKARQRRASKSMVGQKLGSLVKRGTNVFGLATARSERNGMFGGMGKSAKDVGAQIREEQERKEKAEKEAEMQRRLLTNIRMGRNVALAKKQTNDGARSLTALFPSIEISFLNKKVVPKKRVASVRRGREQSFKERFTPSSEREKGSTKSLAGVVPVGTTMSSIQSMSSGINSMRNDNSKRRMSINPALDVTDFNQPKDVDENGEWAIHPNDKNYYRWYTFTLFLVVYNSLMLPWNLMFLSEEESDTTSFVFWFETIIDFMFMLDIWVTFRTGLLDDHGNVVCTRTLIRNQYIKGAFVMDVMSSIPFDLVVLFINSVVNSGGDDADDENGGGGGTSILNYLAMAKTVRLLRINRLIKYMGDMGGMESIVKITRLLGLYILLAHWGGAAFYMIMKSRSSQEATWLETKMTEEKSPEPGISTFSYDACENSTDVGLGVIANGDGCFNLPKITLWSESMYVTMMIMMGDSIDAKNTVETLFATFMSLLGACLTAMMFGQMANIVAGLDREDKRYEELMGHVKDQVGQLELLPETRDRVVDYYEFQWRINSGMDRAQFLSSLSPCLRIEILLSVYADVVGKISFLHVPEHPEFICYIVERLSTAFYLPSDVIVHEGELTSAFSFVYFVTLGQVAVYKTTAAEKILHTMGIGDYFGEMAYLDVGSRRTSSCCALTNCDIALLKFGDIDDLADSFPAFADNIRGLMKKNLQRSFKASKKKPAPGANFRAEMGLKELQTGGSEDLSSTPGGDGLGGIVSSISGNPSTVRAMKSRNSFLDPNRQGAPDRKKRDSFLDPARGGAGLSDSQTQIMLQEKMAREKANLAQEQAIKDAKALMEEARGRKPEGGGGRTPRSTARAEIKVAQSIEEKMEELKLRNLERRERELAAGEAEDTEEGVASSHRESDTLINEIVAQSSSMGGSPAGKAQKPPANATVVAVDALLAA
ncbi:hypothetical protein TeGR_g14642, partial [Tetraparma gracilis]